MNTLERDWTQSARTESVRQVPYARATELELLVGLDGGALIPISSDAELNSVRDVVELHGGELVEVAAVPAPNGARRQRSGSVVALGPQVARAAALYAHLSGRQWIEVDHVDRLPADEELAVVIVTTDRIDTALMERLYGTSSSRRSVPGLIATFGAEDATSAVKRQAAALACARQRAGGRTLIYPSVSCARIERSEGVFVGGDEPREGLLRELSAGASTLAMFVHSQGMNISLGGNLLLCPLAMDREINAKLRPLCLEIGRCTDIEHAPPREEAWESGRLIDFAAVRAQLLVVFGCDIVRTCDSWLDPEFNMAPMLAMRSTVGACITTWRSEQGDRSGMMLNSLLNDVADGKPVGRALQDFACSEVATARQVSLCLLGDPDYAVASSTTLTPLPTQQKPRQANPERRARRSTSLAQVGLRRTMLLDAPARCQIKPIGRWKELDTALSALGLHLLTAGGSGDVATAWDEANALFVEFLAGYPWLERIVSPYGRWQSAASCPCHFCGARARSFTFRFHADALPDLTSIHCEACHAVSNALDNWSPPLSLEAIGSGRLTLRGPRDHIRGFVCIHSASWRNVISPPKSHASIALPWPGAAGVPQPEFVLPEALPVGPLSCFVILAQRDRVATIEVRYPRDH